MTETAIVRLGKDGRVSLGGFGVKPGQKFRVHTDVFGRVILTPVEEEKPGEDQDSVG